MTHTTVVLGGGVGGTVAASELRRQLPAENRVVLIEREGTHRFAASYLWVLVGQRRPEQVERPMAGLKAPGVEFVQASVQAIHLDDKEVATSQGPYPYDSLIVSLGAEFDAASVPGLADAGETFYTLEGAQRLRDRLATFEGNRIAILVAATPFKCPAAPYEAAFLIDALMRRRGKQVAIDVYTPEKLPMPVAGPKVGNALVEMLRSRRIGFHPEHKVASVEPDQRLVHFANDATASYDLLAYVPHRAPAVVREAGLTDASGWVPVDAHTLAAKAKDVYVLGDVAAVRLPSGLMLPKAGVFAHGEAQVVARNIASRVKGEQAQARFDGHGACWIETGDGRAAYGKGDFFAQPTPQIALHPPARRWHWGKVGFEKYWMWKWYK